MRRFSVFAFAALGATLAMRSVMAAPPVPTYHVLKKIVVGGDGGWDYLTMDAASRRLYISRGNQVMVVDVDKDKVVGTIDNTPGVHGIALAPKLGRGFTSNGRDNSITIFDLKTLKTITRVSVGKNPDCIIYDPVTNRVFTFNGGSNDASAVNAADGKLVGTIPLGGRPEYAVTGQNGHIYDNIEDKSEIVDIDAQALTVRHHWSVAPGDGPSGLAMDSKHHRLFSVCGNQKMIVMDSENGKVVATPTIGDGPDAAGFDPKTGLAFSSNGEGTLTVIREVTPNQFEVVANTRTEAGARTMTIDSRTHAVITCTAKALPQAPGASRYRRSYTPGSFTVLVVAP